MSSSSSQIQIGYEYWLTILVAIPTVVILVCGMGEPLLVALLGLIVITTAALLVYRPWSLMDLCYLAMIGICLRQAVAMRWGFALVGGLVFALLIGLAIFCWLLAAIRGNIRRPFAGNGPYISILMIFFVGWTALTYFTAVDRATALRATLILPVVMLWGHWVVPRAVRQSADAEKVLRLFVYVAAFIVIFTTLTGLVPLEYRGFRLGWWGLKDWEARMAEDISMDPLAVEAMATGRSLPVAFFGHPNPMAGLLMLCVGPTLYFLFKSRERKSRVLMALLLMGVACYIVLSGNRTSLGGGIICALVFTYLYSRRAFLFTMLVVLLISVVIFSVVHIVVYKYGVVFSGHQIVTKWFGPDVTSGRLELWPGVIRNIKQRPWLGLGINGATFVRKRNLLMPGFSTAHNAYLRLAEETGLPTALWLLTYIVILISTAWRVYAYQPQRKLLGAAFLGIFASVFFHFNFSVFVVPSLNFGPSGIAVVFLAGSLLALAALPPETESEIPATTHSAAETG